MLKESSPVATGQYRDSWRYLIADDHLYIINDREFGAEGVWAFPLLEYGHMSKGHYIPGKKTVEKNKKSIDAIIAGIKQEVVDDLNKQIRK